MFPEMYKIIPEGEIGVAKIQHRTPSKLDCMRSALHGQILEERPIATLFVNGTMMMSDGPEEHRSNSEVVWRAKGNVLIAGLGMTVVQRSILP